MRGARTSSRWLSRRGRSPARRPRLPLRVEELENRTLPSITPVAHPLMAAHMLLGASPNLSAPFTPAQIQGAYGYNAITFSGGVKGDGTGQTIAIVDAYNQPNLVSDLTTFDSQWGLPALNLTRIDEHGNPINGQVANSSSWGLEEALDVEWVHSVAPQAKVVLVEASSASFADLTAADTEAVRYGAAVVSNSWGGGEFSGESSYDHIFTSGGNTVTFVFSTGDSGAPGEYPAYSPNVLAVGGTHLSINTNVQGQPVWGGETGWSGSGGGTSRYEAEPSYQKGVQHTNKRTIPDVSADADPNTGVYVYDSYYPGGGGWFQVGGTSLAAPLWSGLLGIANQGRALAGKGTLGDAQNAQYTLPTSDFHDIISGNNGGFRAKAGYDEVTGLGSPLANLIAPALVNATSAPPPNTVVSKGHTPPPGIYPSLAQPISGLGLYPANYTGATTASTPLTPAPSAPPVQAVASGLAPAAVQTAAYLSGGGGSDDALLPDAAPANAAPAAPDPMKPADPSPPKPGMELGGAFHQGQSGGAAAVVPDAVFLDDNWAVSVSVQTETPAPTLGDAANATDSAFVAGLVTVTALCWQGRFLEAEKRRWRGLAF